MTVKRVYHRNNPILTCTASNKPPHPHLFERCFIRSAGLWEALDKAGVPNIKGVWVHEAGAGRTFNVVSIKTAYYGHSRHALVLATHLGPAGYGGRWTIVVDDDIDPSDMYAVIWAMGTRCDPATDVDFIRKCWSSKIDPMIFDEHYYNSPTGSSGTRTGTTTTTARGQGSSSVSMPSRRTPGEGTSGVPSERPPG